MPFAFASIQIENLIKLADHFPSSLLSTEERKELERVSRLEAAINAVYVAAKEARDASA